MQNPDKQTLQTNNMSNSDSSDEEDVWKVHDSVVHLTDQTFNQKLKENKVMLVMFYATWCGHCKMLKPKYSDASKELFADGHKNIFAMIECNQNPQMAEEYEIQGYPVLKLFMNGVYVKDYTGKRDKDEIKTFMMQALKDAKSKQKTEL